jgi:hypothetical protein
VAGRVGELLEALVGRAQALDGGLEFPLGFLGVAGPGECLRLVETDGEPGETAEPDGGEGREKRPVEPADGQQKHHTHHRCDAGETPRDDPGIDAGPDAHARSRWAP